jgi:hypothetical protein
VAKIFKGECYESLLAAQLAVFFTAVFVTKPDSSRARSAEHFVVCKGFRPPAQYTPILLSLFAAPPAQQHKTANALAKDSAAATTAAAAVAATAAVAAVASDRKADGSAVAVQSVNDIVVPFLACGDLQPYDTMPPARTGPAAAIAAPNTKGTSAARQSYSSFLADAAAD